MLMSVHPDVSSTGVKARMHSSPCELRSCIEPVEERILSDSRFVDSRPALANPIQPRRFLFILQTTVTVIPARHTANPAKFTSSHVPRLSNEEDDILIMIRYMIAMT